MITPRCVPLFLDSVTLAKTSWPSRGSGVGRCLLYICGSQFNHLLEASPVPFPRGPKENTENSSQYFCSQPQGSEKMEVPTQVQREQILPSSTFLFYLGSHGLGDAHQVGEAGLLCSVYPSRCRSLPETPSQTLRIIFYRPLGIS